MKKVRLLILFFFLVNPVVFVNAQEYEGKTQNKLNSSTEGIKDTDIDIVAPDGTKVDKTKFKLGPGMEVIKIGETNIVAPKGVRVHKLGSQIFFEDTGEYLGRKFDEIERRFNKIEEKQEELKKELEQLNKVVDEIYKRSLTTK